MGRSISPIPAKLAEIDCGNVPICTTQVGFGPQVPALAGTLQPVNTLPILPLPGPAGVSVNVMTVLGPNAPSHWPDSQARPPGALATVPDPVPDTWTINGASKFAVSD